jgi:hypothetical protein
MFVRGVDFRARTQIIERSVQRRMLFRDARDACKPSPYPAFVPARNSLAIALGMAHGELSPLMKNYRAYAVWPNGNFEGYEALICVDDDEAIGRARRLADKSAIELWSGERFITRLEHKSK